MNLKEKTIAQLTDYAEFLTQVEIKCPSNCGLTNFFSEDDCHPFGSGTCIECWARALDKEIKNKIE